MGSGLGSVSDEFKRGARRGFATLRRVDALPRRSTLAWIGLLLLPACALLPSSKDPYDLSIVAGFKAGAACSAVFVAGRPAETLADAELALTLVAAAPGELCQQDTGLTISNVDSPVSTLT